MKGFQFKKNVIIVCTLEIGDKVWIDGYGYQFDGKIQTIEDIKLAVGSCESNVLVKLKGYDSYIDSNWLDKPQ